MTSGGFAVPLWAEGVRRVEGKAPIASREHCDLLIIGAGFLGLNAARIAARSGLSVRVLEARKLGEGPRASMAGRSSPA